MHKLVLLAVTLLVLELLHHAAPCVVDLPLHKTVRHDVTMVVGVGTYVLGSLLAVGVREDTGGNEHADGEALGPHTDLHDLLGGRLLPEIPDRQPPSEHMDQSGDAYLLRQTSPPATAMPAAQLPNMILYWFRVAQSLSFSSAESWPQRTSSCFSNRSSSRLPAPVHVDSSNSTPRRSAWTA